ncbi:MAG: YggT family protein [Gammaproteobacteria bacterium]|jgi:YggT family protein
MGSDYLSDPLVFLIQVVFGVYTLLVVLRFLLQLVRADFYNPLSQFIVKATTPALKPLRRVIPGVGGVDLSSLLLAWLLKTVEFLLIYLVKGFGFLLLPSLVVAIPELVTLVINIFLFGILILVILSWVAPGGGNPAVLLLYQLTGPLLEPVRRRMPEMGGLDLSPMVVMVGLVLLKMLLVPPLETLARQLAA